MSSFRWGMIASPTPTNSQVTVWELRHLLISPHSSNVLLTVLHSEVQLGSACIPPHFGLSLCNALEQISPPCPIWKGTFIDFIWGIAAWSDRRGCRERLPLCLYPFYPTYPRHICVQALAFLLLLVPSEVLDFWLAAFPFSAVIPATFNRITCSPQDDTRWSL